MTTEPQAEHRWLTRLVGDWDYEIDAAMEPGQPPVRHTGSEHVAALGGFWVVCHGSNEMGEAGTMGTIMTLGYDPDQGRYVGTHINTMMPFLWRYQGTLDAAGNALTLDAQGPGFIDPAQMQLYRDTITFLSDDHRTLTSAVQDDDGTWHEFMTAHYRRRG